MDVGIGDCFSMDDGVVDKKDCSVDKERGFLEELEQEKSRE